MADAFENILGQPQVRDFLRSHGGERPREPRLPVHRAGRFEQDAGRLCASRRPILCPKGARGPRGGNCGACDVCRARHAHASIPTCATSLPKGRAAIWWSRSATSWRDTSLRRPSRPTRRSTSSTAWTCWARAGGQRVPQDAGGTAGRRGARPFGPHARKRAAHHRLALPGGAVPHTSRPTRGGGHPRRRTREPRWRRRASPSRPATGPSRAAVEFLKSNERLAFRSRVLEALASSARLPTTGTWWARPPSWLVLAKAPARRRCAPRRRRSWPRTRTSWRSRPSGRSRRATSAQLTAKSFESLRQLTAIVRSWLRDVLAVCAGHARAGHQRGRARGRRRGGPCMPTRRVRPPLWPPCAAATRRSRIMYPLKPASTRCCSK